MPREGTQYRITEDWQDRVRLRMKELGIGSIAELARRVGIGRTAMWQAMQPGAVQTGWMPEIHKALGWHPPVNTAEETEAEVVNYFRQLSDVEKGRQLEKLKRAVEEERKRKRS